MSVRFASLAAMPVLLWASMAEASPIDGRFRLGFDLTPLSHTSTTLTLQDDGFGNPEDLETSQLVVGVGNSMGVLIGYGVSEHIVLGGRVLISSVTTETDTTDEIGAADTERTVTSTTLLLPYLTYVGGDEGSSVRVAIGGTFGYAGTSVTQGSFERSTSGYAFGANIGFLGFVADRFSIDPSVFVIHEEGSVAIDDPELEFSAGNVGYSATTIGISVAFSGWLGGHAKPRARREREAGYWAPRPRRAMPAPPPAPVKPTGLISARATIDSAVIMLLGSPEERGSATALRIQRYAPASEPACNTLVIENDGAVAATLPLQQSTSDKEAIQQVTVQAVMELEIAEAMVRARVTKLRWCDNERTLTREARDGVAEFVAMMHKRLPAPAAPTAAPPAAAPPAAAPAAATPAVAAPAAATPAAPSTTTTVSP